MTPFELDGLINANWYKRPSTAGSGGVADMRKKQENMGELYLDEEDNPHDNEFGSRLYDKDFEAMQAHEKNQIMMGIDLTDPEETQKGKTRAQIAEQQQRQQYVQSLITEELDMSYYYLTHDGFKAVLPQLESQYLTSVKRLNLAGNALTDISIAELCLSMK